jgi:hypothetical protein
VRHKKLLFLLIIGFFVTGSSAVLRCRQAMEKLNLMAQQ